MARKATTQFPQWALKFKTPGTELRCIRGKYYLYECSSVYDPEKKRSRKVTGKYLGSITEEGGLVPRREKKETPLDVGHAMECGITAYYRKCMGPIREKLEKHFPDTWRTIMAAAMCRLAGLDNLDHMLERYRTSMITYDLPCAGLAPDFLKRTIRRIGSDREAIEAFFREFASDEDDNIVFGGIGISSQYTQSAGGDIPLSLIGVFSVSRQMPVYYRIQTRNMDSFEPFRKVLEDLGLNKATLIADGPFMEKNSEEGIKAEGLKRIIPLERSDSEVDYSPFLVSEVTGFDGCFTFNGKVIWHKSIDIREGLTLYEFLDSRIRVEESEDRISRIGMAKEDNGDFDEKEAMEEFHDDYPMMGSSFLVTIGIDDPKKAYESYMSFLHIGKCADSFRRAIGQDAESIREKASLEGYLFINFIALQWYFSIYRAIAKAGKTQEISVRDAARLLQNIKAVEIDETYHLCEMTDEEKELLKILGIDIGISLPRKQGAEG